MSPSDRNRFVETLPLKIKSQRHFARLALLFDVASDRREDRRGPRRQSGCDHRLQVSWLASQRPSSASHRAAVQQRFNLRRGAEPPDAMAAKCRRNHFGVVENQNIAGRSNDGKSRTVRSSKASGPPPAIWPHSRGTAGRRAIRSGGSSKSKSETRMAPPVYFTSAATRILAILSGSSPVRRA